VSSSVYITFDPRDEGVSRDNWNAWAAGHGLLQTPGTGEHGHTWRKGPGIEVDYHSKRRMTFSAFYMSDEVPELIRLALDFWTKFGGSLDAATEIRTMIWQMFMGMQRRLTTPGGTS